MMVVRLGDRVVGEGAPALVVAEIGINHNGDLQVCKDLIELSAKAGCEVVKFQKRTIETVFSAEDLGRPRESPFGSSNGDLKRGLRIRCRRVCRHRRVLRHPRREVDCIVLG